MREINETGEGQTEEEGGNWEGTDRAVEGKDSGPRREGRAELGEKAKKYCTEIRDRQTDRQVAVEYKWKVRKGC